MTEKGSYAPLGFERKARIGIWMQQGKNRDLLKQLIDNVYETIVIKKPEDLDGYLDLLIADTPAIHKHSAAMVERREREENIFLPIILIMGKGDDNTKVEGLLDVSNELIRTPINRTELLVRVGILLRTRSISIELEKRFKLLVSNARIGLLLSDDQGRIEHANIAMRDIVRSDRELSGTHFGCILVNRQDQETLLNELRESGNVSDRELLIRRTDGSETWVLMNLVRGFDKFRGEHLIVASVNEIGDRMRIRAERKKLIDDVETKMVNIATMIDGIRNPISVICAMVQMDKPLDRKKMNEMICRVNGVLISFDQGWAESQDKLDTIRKMIEVDSLKPLP